MFTSRQLFSRTMLIAAAFLSVTGLLSSLVVLTHHRGQLVNGAAPVVSKPHIGIAPYLTIIEDAHQFDPKAKTVSDLLASNNLMSIPEQIKPLSGKIRLTPTGLEVGGIERSECMQMSDHGVTPEDRGVDGIQCIHVPKDKSFSMVFRESAIPPHLRGLWVWHATLERSERQHSPASRILLSADKNLATECPGQLLANNGVLRIDHTMDFCLPAFEGEQTQVVAHGPFYSSEPRAHLVVRSGGGAYTLEIAF